MLGIGLLTVALVYCPLHFICLSATTGTNNPPPAPAAPRYIRLTDTIAAALRVLGAMLSRPDAAFGRTLSERLVLTVCLWHAIVMTGIFQGQLFNVYTHRQTVANVNTLEQLASSDLRLVIRAGGVLQNGLSEAWTQHGSVIERLNKRLLHVPANSTVYGTVLGTPNVADIDRVLNYELVAQRYVRADGFSRLHVLEENPK